VNQGASTPFNFTEIFDKVVQGEIQTGVIALKNAQKSLFFKDQLFIFIMVDKV
jgi:hypothetical protein